MLQAQLLHKGLPLAAVLPCTAKLLPGRTLPERGGQAAVSGKAGLQGLGIGQGRVLGQIKRLFQQGQQVVALGVVADRDRGLALAAGDG